MKLLVKSPVWDDLREIALRISKDNPEAADRFLTAANDAFDLLKRHPRIGRLHYIVFYLPTATEVQILAVVHGARDISSVVAQRLK